MSYKHGTCSRCGAHLTDVEATLCGGDKCKNEATLYRPPQVDRHHLDTAKRIASRCKKDELVERLAREMEKREKEERENSTLRARIRDLEEKIAECAKVRAAAEVVAAHWRARRNAGETTPSLSLFPDLKVDEANQTDPGEKQEITAEDALNEVVWKSEQLAEQIALLGSEECEEDRGRMLRALGMTEHEWTFVAHKHE